MNKELSLNEFYWKVAELAIEQGYSAQQIRIFYSDIVDYYNDGKSVEECVGEVF